MNDNMYLTVDETVDCGYITLTSHDLTPGRDTVEVPVPASVQGGVNLDFKDGKLVGIEIIGVKNLLHDDIL